MSVAGAALTPTLHVFGLELRWSGGIPYPYHDFLPKYLWCYVFTKVPYLYFMVISALQARACRAEMTMKYRYGTLVNT